MPAPSLVFTSLQPAAERWVGQVGEKVQVAPALIVARPWALHCGQWALDQMLSLPEVTLRVIGAATKSRMQEVVEWLRIEMVNVATPPDATDGAPCTVSLVLPGAHICGPAEVADALALGEWLALAEGFTLGVSLADALGVVVADADADGDWEPETDADGVGVTDGVGVPARAVGLADTSAVTFLLLEPNNDDTNQTISTNANKAAPKTTARRIW